MFIINIKDNRPLYEQIVDNITFLIFNNTLAPDEKLPSVRSLAIELSLNPNTIQKAYSKLESLGMIYSITGRGSFVCSNMDTLYQNKINSLKQNIKKLVKEANSIGINKKTILSWIDERS